MPANLRHPRAAALAVALASAAPLLASGTAGAEVVAGQPEPGSQVRFRGGGLLGLGVLICTSRPDQIELTVRAEGVVSFVNRTGQGATLRIDGRDAGTVGAHHVVAVVFHRGPVSVSMIPVCRPNLNRAFGSVNVEVAGAPAGSDQRSDLMKIGDPRLLAAGSVAVGVPVPAAPAPGRANGLVALVAAVCVVGVSAGAIRTILAQRVSRSSAA